MNAFAKPPATHDFQQAADFLAMLDPQASEFLFLGLGPAGSPRPHRGTLGSVWPHIVATNLTNGLSWFVTINETRGARRLAPDIVRIRAFFIDCDTPESVAALMDWLGTADRSLRPNALVSSSGKKLHAYWMVEDCPLERFETVQRGLANKFGSDNVSDPPRIMRLPGTLNVKAKYAQPHLCKLRGANDRTWHVDEFVKALGIVEGGTRARPTGAPFENTPGGSDGMGYMKQLRVARVAALTPSNELAAGVEVGWYDSLTPAQKDEVVRHACEAISTRTKYFERTEDGGNNDAWLRLMCALARSGAPSAEAIFIEFASKAKHPDGEVELSRQFHRDDVQAGDGITVGTLLGMATAAGADFSQWKQCAAVAALQSKGVMPAPGTGALADVKPGTYPKDQAIALLSERYFWGEPPGAAGSYYYITAPGAAVPVNYNTLTGKLANICVPGAKVGEAKPAFPVWNASPHRPLRELIFEPKSPSGVGGITNQPFNTWQGFNTRRAPDRSRLPNIHQLIRDVLCNGNAEHYEYVLNCMAWLRQHTGEPLGVCLNLIGTGGMGKSLFGEHLVAGFFGAHGSVLSSRDQLANKFNARFEGKVLVFVEEVVFSGDRALTDRLKVLITGGALEIERKFCEATSTENKLTFIFATNHQHAFHADSGMSRRVFPLRVSQDKTRWQRLITTARADIFSGGREAFWEEMERRDISKFSPWEFPHNDEIMRQRRMSTDPVEDFLLAVADGGLPEKFGGFKRKLPCTATKAELWEAFKIHATRIGDMSEAKLATLVEGLLGIPYLRLPQSIDPTRKRAYRLPDGKTVEARLGMGSGGGGRDEPENEDLPA